MRLTKFYLFILIILLFGCNVFYAESIPKYIDLDIVKGTVFTGADNTIEVTNNSDYTVVSWSGGFILPENIKIWSSSSSLMTPLKKAGTQIVVSPQTWNKTIKPGETIKIEFNTNADYKQKVILGNIHFVGITENVYDKTQPAANEDVLIIVKKRDANAGYDSIQRNIISLYNKFTKNESGSGYLKVDKYNIVLLIPMIELKTTEQQENEYYKYLSEDFMQWAIRGLVPNAQFDYSTVQNVIKYLKSPNLKYIYYVGDGGWMTCSSIECTNPSSNYWNTPVLTAEEVSNIKFNKNQIWILNACHGIIGSFPLALFDSGLKHFAAGATSLRQPFDSDLGVFAFANVLTGQTLTESMKNAGNKVLGMYHKDPAFFKGYGYLFNGVWGIVDGIDNCYLYNVLDPIPAFNKKIIMPDNPTIKTWPFKFFRY